MAPFLFRVTWCLDFTLPFGYLLEVVSDFRRCPRNTWRTIRPSVAALLLFNVLVGMRPSAAQSLGNAGSLEVSVYDASGAAVPGATVELQNRVSGHHESGRTGSSGLIRFMNVPFNPYRLTVSAAGFGTAQQDAVIQSSIPFSTRIVLKPVAQREEITVRGDNQDLLERDPTANTDIDRKLISRLPIQDTSSPLSTLITMATPGVAADSNGMFHPLGEEGDTSLSIDNQPITDQQGRMFSSQLPLGAIESMEIITEVPPAEFGDKNGLIVRTTTRSGLGTTKPSGSLSAEYGSFGSSSGNFDLAVGKQTLGNFLIINGLNTGRFLDTPEFVPIHANGDTESFFDRADYQPDTSESLHLNLFLSRSWFQTPNTYDNQSAGQDQRELLQSFNLAPSYTHLFNPFTIFGANAYVRSDQTNYFPSANVFADQPATLRQARRLTNAGLKLELSHVRGIHNAKAGLQISRTFLSETFQFGITDPTLNSPCVDAKDDAVSNTNLTQPAQCAGAGFMQNSDFRLGLLPYDLTRKGSPFNFQGKKDIQQEALYLQDMLGWKQLSLMLGIRVDQYNGFSSGTGIQPRFGLSYLVRSTSTVLRASYGRLFETPYNEGLIVASFAGIGSAASPAPATFAVHPLQPGTRNQFDVGLQQAIGKHLVVDADYIWKFTRFAFDSDSLYNTPLVFPAEWRKSKIDGVSVRVNCPELYGFSAYAVLGHVRARFFGPETGGILLNPQVEASAFRIDQDQAFQQTTHLQYQFGKKGPWVAFNWRYDSGAVANSVPDFATALKLTGDQQAAIGLFCGSSLATVTAPLTACSSSRFGATRVRIPAPGTENDDLNPPRISAHHVLDLGAGIENMLPADRYRVSLRFEILNLANTVALYNFLSTFSGTHFITPRSYQAELGFHF